MSFFIHGDNIDNKVKREHNQQNRKLLKEIKQNYLEWKASNLKITGTSKPDIIKKVELLNDYKNFIDQPKFRKEKGRPNGFTFQSKLHSTVIEEFLYYLFKDISKLKNKNINFGPTKAYSNLYFAPPNIDAFEESSNIVINIKDQDFSISKEILVQSRFLNNKNWQENKIYVPIVWIKCKRYLNKRMFDRSASAAEKLKKCNPYCIFLIITETYEVSLNIEPRLSSIDQVYVLRRDDRKNPIYEDIVCDLFETVVWKLKPAKEKLKVIHSNIEKYGQVYV